MPQPDLILQAEASYVSAYKRHIEKGQTEVESQKAAIEEALLELIRDTSFSTGEIWGAICVAHLKRKTGKTLNLTQSEIAQVIAAHQSWIKSSGHAAEEFWKSEGNRALKDTGLQMLLQRDISSLSKEDLIGNKGPQRRMLNDWLGSSSFDLYLSQKIKGKHLVFGCVQSKTSIRDRVTREREPSNQAMDHKFWSIALVVDGDFLRLDKFKRMVNGGDEIYARCGWHKMYVLDVEKPEDRIVRLERDFSNFAADAVSAAKHFLDGGEKFSSGW